jgi:hypothetical protein
MQFNVTNDNAEGQMLGELETSALIDKKLLELYIYYEIIAPLAGYCLGFLLFICSILLEKFTKSR